MTDARLDSSEQWASTSEAPLASQPPAAALLADQLLQRVISADALASELSPLAEVWQKLAVGCARVRASFSTLERCYLVLSPRQPTEREKLGLRHADCVARFLRGDRQKSTALDSNVAPSTVSAHTAECLLAMGMDRRASRVPVLLVAAANAFHDGLANPARASALHDGQSELLVFSLPRPDLALSCKLSPAERSVVGLLLEGHSHAEMSEARNRSTRTIANQLAAVFQKLGVSGRIELLRYVLKNPIDPDEPDEGAESSRRPRFVTDVALSRRAI